MEQYVAGGDAHARSLDARDPLSSFRERFYLRDETVYLDGNSLGLLSVDAEASVLDALESWKILGVRGWMEANPDWFTLGESLGARMAALVGAEPDAVAVTGTTTVNLHQLVGTFYRPEGDRRKIIATSLDFPSDVYALKSQIRTRGGDPDDDLDLVPSRDGRTIAEDDIIDAMDENVVVAWLPSVLYRSGQLLDMPRLVSAAHKRGIMIGFDCAHSAGAIPHELDRWEVDFASWCTYKYLNAGPGSVGALYVNRRHWDTEPALAGWWGYRKDRQFEMRHDWEGAGHAGAFQISTIPLLSAASLLGSLDIFSEAGIGRIREKSLAMTDFLIDAITARGLVGGRHGFSIGTPSDHARRGGHIALEHDKAEVVSERLVDGGVVVDFRQPKVIRMAPVALYTSFSDLTHAIDVLEDIMNSRDLQRGT
jgi:kynureninase